MEVEQGRVTSTPYPDSLGALLGAAERVLSLAAESSTEMVDVLLFRGGMVGISMFVVALWDFVVVLRVVAF